MDRISRIDSGRRLIRRLCLAQVGAIVGVAGLFPTFAQAQATSVTYLGAQTVPTGTVVGGTEIGGLSGISYNPYANTFTAITDDSRNPGASRFWNVSLDYDAAGFSAATVNSSVGLKTAAGGVPPLADTEGIAGNLDGSFFVSHEGLAAGTDPIDSIPPWIRKFNSQTGRKEADIPLPEKFLPRNASGQQVPPNDETQTSGVRSNLSLESLGLAPSKKILFTANEAALKQDDARVFDGSSNQAQSSNIRIVRFTGVPNNPTAAEEKVYLSDQGTLFFLIRRFNTVTDILPIDDSGKLLVMERGLANNNTNTGSYRIRIYEVDFQQSNATNVAGIPALIGATYTRLNKTLVWQSSTNMDNVEGMGFGRDVQGFRTLVLTSDNNFSSSQVTQFHVLLTSIPAVPRRTLNANVIGSGSVAATPSLAWYPDGSEVLVSALPATNFYFGDWTGDAAGATNPLLLTMTSNKAVTARFLSPFQNWGTSYFPTGEMFATGWATSDPDGDGLVNLLEYALNLNPREPTSQGLPLVEVNGGTLTISYQKDTTKPDIRYQVEASAVLTTWVDQSDVLVSEEGSLETRQTSVSIPGVFKFLRLKITQLF